MPLNNAGMTVAANALRSALLFGQLHSAAAGTSGTSNLTSAGRQAITWTSVSGLGNFTLASQVNFTGGAANGTVYSITLWSASTGGTFYGEYAVGGDVTFNSAGNYAVTAIDLVGTAT